MFRKIILLVVIALFTACGSTKSKIKSSRSESDTTVSKETTKKVKGKKTIVTKKPDYGNQTETLESTSKTIVTSGVVAEYINAYKEIAKYNMQKYGIPASIILAQGLLESGSGAGELSKKANNHFGIKCHTEWSGDSVKHDDDALQECFRKYDDPAESYKDHALFLTSRKRYAGLFNLEKGDYVGWAKGLKAAGYATDPKYPDKLIGLIERNQLYKYDDEVLGISSKAEADIVSVPAVTETVTVSDNKTVTQANTDSALSTTYEVRKGDTLYSISRMYNTTVAEIKRKNGLLDNHIEIGQLLKI